MRVISNLVEAHVFRKRNDDLEFLLLKRAESEKYPGIWQMVTGSSNENEKAYQTAVREISEETGLKPIEFWVVPHMNSFYSHENDYVCMVPVFAALVENFTEVKISDEHSEFKWVGRDEAKKLLAWKGQRESVDIIYEYFINEHSFLKFVNIRID